MLIEYHYGYENWKSILRMRVHILSYRANTVFIPHLIGEDSQICTRDISLQGLTEGKSASRSRIPSEAALFSRRLLVVDHSPRRKHASTHFVGPLIDLKNMEKRSLMTATGDGNYKT